MPLLDAKLASMWVDEMLIYLHWLGCGLVHSRIDLERRVSRLTLKFASFADWLIVRVSDPSSGEVQEGRSLNTRGAGKKQQGLLLGAGISLIPFNGRESDATRSLVIAAC